LHKPMFNCLYSNINHKNILMSDKRPNDLEAQIERWKFRNEQLHKHNQKITSELREIRKDNEKLAKEINDKIKLLREKGVI